MLELFLNKKKKPEYLKNSRFKLLLCNIHVQAIELKALVTQTKLKFIFKQIERN